MKITVLALAFALTCFSQDQLDDLLRKGIVEEDVNHNLNAAIKAYQDIVQRFQDDRVAAATAQFRLAECYRKLGKTAEADAAHKQLIAQFSDQTELVERSRRQITPPPQPDSTSRERAILEEKLTLAQGRLSEVRRQVELGAGSTTDLDEAQIAVLRAQSDVITTYVNQSVAKSNENYRRQRRAVLEQAVELARKIVAAEEKKYLLGAVSGQDVSRRKSELFDLQLALERAGK
jgi:tetratricopeptide (TPR) repeat protein